MLLVLFRGNSGAMTPLAAPGSGGGSTTVRRYRLPRQLCWGFVAVASLNIAETSYQLAVQHQVTHAVSAVALTITALVVGLVPMTTVTNTEIRRWWSTQRSCVPWSEVQDVEASAKKMNQTNVYVRRGDGDRLLLLGVPTAAVAELRSFAARS